MSLQGDIVEKWAYANVSSKVEWIWIDLLDVWYNTATFGKTTLTFKHSSCNYWKCLNFSMEFFICSMNKQFDNNIKLIFLHLVKNSYLFVETLKRMNKYNDAWWNKQCVHKNLIVRTYVIRFLFLYLSSIKIYPVKQ